MLLRRASRAIDTGGILVDVVGESLVPVLLTNHLRDSRYASTKLASQAAVPKDRDEDDELEDDHGGGVVEDETGDFPHLSFSPRVRCVLRPDGRHDEAHEVNDKEATLEEDQDEIFERGFVALLVSSDNENCRHENEEVDEWNEGFEDEWCMWNIPDAKVVLQMPGDRSTNDEGDIEQYDDES